MSDKNGALVDEFVDDDELEAGDSNKYLLCRIGEEVYGIDIRHVTDIVEMQGITYIPDMPEYVKGVINLRGKVIPSVDLRLRFGMQGREYDDRTCIVIIRMGDFSVGFIVDTVTEVLDVPGSDVEPPPSFQRDEKKDRYIAGLAKIGQNVRILLDVEKIVKQDELQDIDTNIKEESENV